MRVNYQVVGQDEPIAVELKWVKEDDFGNYCWLVNAKHPVLGRASRFVMGETNVYSAADEVVFDMVLRRVY